MTVSFHAPYYLIAVCILGALAAAYLMYRYTVPRVSRSLRRTLIAIRAAAIALVLISIFEPLVTLHSTEARKAPIAVLADNSLSVSLTDRRGHREAEVRNALKSDAFEQLSRRTDAHLFRFAGAIAPLSPDSFTANGGITDIASAIEEARQRIPQQLRGIVLITDGNYNAGANPLYGAERSAVPIFTVGVGDTAELKDIAVSSAVVNAIGYVGTELPIDAVIRSSGIPASTIAVSVTENGSRVARQMVTIAPTGNGVAETRVRFTYTPTTPGVKRISVEAATVPDEVTPKNNIRTTTVKVLKSKLKAVVISGPPSADVAAVMQSLRTDANIDPTLFTQQPDGTLHSFDTKSTVSSSLPEADAVVLIGFPVRSTPPELVRSIAGLLNTTGCSVLFIAGRTVDVAKLRVFEPVLPFTATGDPIQEQTLVPVVSQRNEYHALLQPDPNAHNNAAWDKLPPLYGSPGTFSAKAQAQVLLTVRVRGIDLSSPLFLSSRQPGKKSLAFLGYGISRWRLLAGSVNETKGFFDLWFPSVVRWLATKDDDAFFRIEPDQELYSQGEPVGFTGQVYNENYEPVDNADVRVSLRNESGRRIADIPLRPLGNGRYEGDGPGLPEGDYTFAGASLRGGDTVSTARGRLSIGGQSVEFFDTRQNAPLLQQMAQRSGGAYTDITQFGDLVNDIVRREDLQPIRTDRTTEIELWNVPLFLSIVIILFSVEWIIRKRSGML